MILIRIIVVVIINHITNILLIIIITIVHGVLIIVILVMLQWTSTSLVPEPLIKIIIKVDIRVILVIQLLLENVITVDRVAIILANALRIEDITISSVLVQ